MPHDMHGNILKVGDTVLIPCQIKAIHLTEEYCNLDLETNIEMYPGNHRMTLALNSRQTMRKGNEQELLRATRVFLDWLSKKQGERELPGALLPQELYQNLVELIPKVNEVLDGPR